MSDLWHLTDLAGERVGGRALYANDDFFAEKENLLKAAAPVFIEEKYTDRGKWMDGWESRRRRTPGHDWCLIRLGLPGIIREVVVDTSYFRGNFPSHCSMEACAADAKSSVEELSATGTNWIEILPKRELKGDTQNQFPINSPYRFTHLRFNIFPDGGVARLRVFGEVLPDWRAILADKKEIDLLAIEHGGRALAASDVFYSHPSNLTMPGRGARMDDGWETKRRRGPGHDWCILQLGIAGTIQRIEVDTAHFKGNFPESCSVEVCRSTAAYHIDPASMQWKVLLPRTMLQADHVHVFEKELADAGESTHIRFNIFPDGGVSRLRLIGIPSPHGRIAHGVAWLNAMLPEAAETAFKNCCGSAKWAAKMAAARPFRDFSNIGEIADRIWTGLSREDWMEAFRAHPRIGEKKAAGQSAEAGRWSSQEQSAAMKASATVQSDLAKANAEYEARFGHIFLICATGKKSEEILASLRERMKNDPETELRVAVEEQQKITRLRLEKWMVS